MMRVKAHIQTASWEKKETWSSCEDRITEIVLIITSVAEFLAINTLAPSVCQ